MDVIAIETDAFENLPKRRTKQCSVSDPVKSNIMYLCKTKSSNSLLWSLQKHTLRLTAVRLITSGKQENFIKDIHLGAKHQTFPQASFGWRRQKVSSLSFVIFLQIVCVCGGRLGGPGSLAHLQLSNSNGSWKATVSGPRGPSGLVLLVFPSCFTLFISFSLLLYSPNQRYGLSVYACVTECILCHVKCGYCLGTWEWKHIFGEMETRKVKNLTPTGSLCVQDMVGNKQISTTL